MDTKAISSGISHSSLPQSYARPGSERRPRSAFSACEIVAVRYLGSDHRACTVQETGDACESHGLFLVKNNGVVGNAVEKMLGVAGEFPQLPVEGKLKLYSDNPSNTNNVDKENVHNWRDDLRLHRYPLSRHESFSAGTMGMLGLLTTAFTPLLQYPVLTPPWRSFMLSNYCGMVMLSTTTLVADVRLRRAGPNSRTRRCSEILRTIIVLSSSLAIISFLSISNPYVALVSLLVWFFLAIFLSLNLYGNLTQPMLPLNCQHNVQFHQRIV